LCNITICNLHMIRNVVMRHLSFIGWLAFIGIGSWAGLDVFRDVFEVFAFCGEHGVGL